MAERERVTVGLDPDADLLPTGEYRTPRPIGGIHYVGQRVDVEFPAHQLEAVGTIVQITPTGRLVMSVEPHPRQGLADVHRDRQ